MYKTISSRLSAPFSPDGQHLDRYLKRKSTVIKSLCEDLIIHDQILIPTQDYLTACGLVMLIGENEFIELIEQNRLKFIRTRGVLGYLRGASDDGTIIIANDPNKQRPQDCSIDQSVEVGLEVIKENIKNNKKLQKLIIENSFSIEWATILEKVKQESINDLKLTNLWESKYNLNKPDLVALPGVQKMQVRVFSPENDPSKNIVDKLLSLTLCNADLYLAEEYQCQSINPFYSNVDLLQLKERRFLKIAGYSEKFWKLLEINNVPDFSRVDLLQDSKMKDIVKISTSRNAIEFRNWFHQNKNLNETEILKEYINLLKQIPWIESTSAKAIRFTINTSLGFVNPILGLLLGAFDSFVIDRLFRGKSAKVFIDDLTRIKF